MRKLILSILTLISLQVPAGISSIGNGGGLGELQFIYYFNNALQIISICEGSSSCQLSPEQKISLRQLKTQYPSLKNMVRISFVPNVARSWTWTRDTLTISQRWLYQNNLDQLRPDADIMAFAFAILISHTQQLDFETTYNQTAKSLFGLSFYSQSVVSNSNEFRFHWITLSNGVNGSTNLKLFVLEDSLNSFSLNVFIQNISPSIDMNSLEVYNVFVANTNSQITVYGSISGLNGSSGFNQRPFKFTASINSQNLIVEESIQLFLLHE